MSPLSCTKGSIVPSCNEYTPSRQTLFGESTALLIVDTKEEYWQDCPLTREDFPNFPQNISNTIEDCRREDVKIIWVMQEGDSPLRTSQRSLFQTSRSSRKRRKIRHLSSQPKQLPTPRMGDTVVTTKGLSGTTNTRLLSLLKENNIDTVLVCGLLTSMCVQHTAFGIFEKGFRTLLVEDACADRGKARHEAALALYGNYMYEMVESTDLEPLWFSPRVSHSIVSEKELPNTPDDSVPKKAFRSDDASDTRSVLTATEVSSTSSDSTNSISNPPVVPLRFPAVVAMTTPMNL